MSASSRTRDGVASSFATAPIVGVVRTATTAAADELARAFISGGLELVEITFTVPEATSLIRTLRQTRGAIGPPWIGAGTVTDAARARRAVDAGAEFLVSPNVSAEVADVARQADTFLILGALTPTEMVEARRLGADLVKVYPLPPVGGAAFLTTVRQPLDDIPILAAGGFGTEEIAAYRAAGALAFGIGSQLLGDGSMEPSQVIDRALACARGEQ